MQGEISDNSYLLIEVLKGIKTNHYIQIHIAQIKFSNS